MSFTDYFMTVDEFAHLVTEAVYECGYFKPGQIAHPEDIEAAFTSTATAVAKGASFASKRKESKESYVESNPTFTNTKI